MAKYTQIPTNTFEQLVINAGILCSGFTPSTGEVTGLLGATSGGISFEDTPSFKDWGEDVDNCMKNTKQLKRMESREVKISGTFITMTAAMAKRLAAVADIDSQDTTKVTPRADVLQSDFEDIWLVCDYSNINTDGSSTGKAGYIAIKLINSLSTGGLKIQTTDKEKGKFSFEFTGHYDISQPDLVPYELYIKAGTADPSQSVNGNRSTK
jgi:hypothetical protein